jgi:acyl-CoA reductase-like NAD-dependent aldehyde dehydrogenase
MSMSSGPDRLLPFVDGAPYAVDDAVPIEDPYRREVVALVGTSDDSAVAAAVTAAHRARRDMAAMPVHQRARLLRAAGDILAGRAEEFAVQVTRSTGKVLKHTRREAQRAPWTLRAAAAAAEAPEAGLPPVDSMPGGEGMIAVSRRFPVGVVAAITPFNAPINLVLHKVAPALAMGNAVVVKPAAEAPWPALEIARLLTDLGFPPGAVNVLPGGAATGRALIADPRVSLITFTGGTEAGTAVRTAAGLRPVLLELGGNSANIVHEDADIELALQQTLLGGFSNNGQSCNSVQRILVHRSRHEQFTAALAANASRLLVGDPMDSATDIGPLIRETSAERVQENLDAAVGNGAVVHLGGRRDRAVIPPTVVSDVSHTEPLYSQEAFAPLVMTEPYETIDEAISLANDTDFALQASVFTRSSDVMTLCFRDLRAGSVIANRSSNFRLDQLPYGGVGASGWGREGPHFAALEMTYIKSLVIAPSP